MDFSDQPAAVREGEEIDTGRLEAFLHAAVPGVGGALTVLQFPRGHSNLTYFIRTGDRELVLRRPPHGTKAKSAHDMGREYHILSALQGIYPYCPKPLAHCEDLSIMGAPFYVMERITGVILRRELPPGMRLSPQQMQALCRNMLKAHVELHAVDYRACGLAEFGKPVGYVERQVRGWSQRYRAARTPDAPESEDIMAWLLAKMPPDSLQPAVIHNDFKLDNLILDPADPLKIIGVLDWEMATIGDPLMDLGCSLAYWIQKDDPPELAAIKFMPSDAPGALTREALVQLYAELAGRSLNGIDFYYVFGLFRLAVIVQQIYYRYYHGQTRDERFKAMIVGVQVLDRHARRLIARSKL
jgi:aminoglycoside phosphotransferase (APT) family kinase protein